VKARRCDGAPSDVFMVIECRSTFCMRHYTRDVTVSTRRSQQRARTRYLFAHNSAHVPGTCSHTTARTYPVPVR